MRDVQLGSRRGVRWGRIGALAFIACLASSERGSAFGWPSEVSRVGRDLGSADSAERAEAARRLVSLSPASARPLVELGLEDEADAVRLAAARAAVAHGLRGMGDQVSSWLKDPVSAVRLAALRVLALDLESRHVPLVARAAADPDENVRLSAVRCLGRARLALASEVAPGLMAALDDASPAIRVEAANGLGRLGDGSTVPALVARSNDAEESVRRAVVVALGAVGEQKATAALSFALTDRAVTVAALAARSLGELGDPSAHAALERVLLEPGFGPLAAAAAEALARLDTRRGWDAILSRLAEEEAAPTLRQLLARPTSTAQESVRACLGQSGGVGLLECARVATRAGLPLDDLLARVRRGGLPTVKLFQVVESSRDVELLVLAIERLARGTASERHAALDLLEKSAPLPRQTGPLLGDALAVPGLRSEDVTRLLLLLEPTDVDAKTLAQLARASDPVTRASARALAALGEVDRRSVSAPFDASPLEASIYGRLLGRGMERALAQRLISELSKRKVPVSAPEFRALEGIPSDLSPRSVHELALLADAEQGPERDRLLVLLASQHAAPAVLEPFLKRASAADRRTLSALYPRFSGLAGLAAQALSDPDPWVRAQAAQGVRSADLEELLRLAGPSEPAFVRTAALLGLARIGSAAADARLRSCELLDAPELGVRAAALVLIDRLAVVCKSRPLEDIVLAEPEPILRQLAARALFRRDSDHRALSSCRAYDVEPEVAVACGAPSSTPTEAGELELGFVEIVPPWLDQPAPSSPYALLESSGNITIGLTDRRGQAPALGPRSARVLDPRLAL